MCCSIDTASKRHKHDNYLPVETFNQQIANYYTKAEVDSLLATLQDQIDNLQAEVEPIGTIKIWTTATIPTGWLKCDGTEYSGGPGEYPLLFGVIGTTFNTGGETGFRVPNLQGRFPVGLNPPDDIMNSLGDIGGEANHALTPAEGAQHSHTYRAADNVYRVDIAYGTTPGAGTGFVRNLGGATTLTQFIGTSGNGDPHNNLPPFLAIHYIIKAE